VSRFKSLAAFAAALALSCAGYGLGQSAARQSAAGSQQLLPVEFATANGARLFRVEVARSEEKQERGLMFRDKLPPNGGMIFPMTPPRVATFWMKNTLIPLDMIFIRADGSIARIAPETIPYSLAPVSSGDPVAAVLEIAGGEAARLGITESDHASWPGGPKRH
jgi:uncharacterized membrane protein (UPF0127 family)